MKRSKLLSMPILIALGLFLIAPKPSPRPAESTSRQIPQQNNEGEKDHHVAGAGAASVSQLQPTPSETPTSENNSYMEQQLVVIEGKIAEFTLLLVLVGALQFGAALFQAYSARQSASSSANSVKIAQLALETHRPYGIVRIVESVKGEYRGACITLANDGNSPLDIVEFNATRDIFDGPRVLPKCEYWAVNNETRKTGMVIPPRETCTHDIPFHLTPAENPALWRGDKTLAVYGRIRYRGGPPNIIYETYFFWWYLPTGSANPSDEMFVFVPGPAELNNRT